MKSRIIDDGILSKLDLIVVETAKQKGVPGPTSTFSGRRSENVLGLIRARGSQSPRQ